MLPTWMIEKLLEEERHREAERRIQPSLSIPEYEYGPPEAVEKEEKSSEIIDFEV